MKRLYRKYLKPLFFSRRLYSALVSIIVVFIISFWFSFLYTIAQIALLFFAAFVLLDYIILFARKNAITAKRITRDRFSNGDENKVSIQLHNHYPFKIRVNVIDEIPVQFQNRNFNEYAEIAGDNSHSITYKLYPTERGEYVFYDIHVFVKSPLQLIIRRITHETKEIIKVVPSFLSMRKYELKAHSSNLAEAGNKRMRKLGHSLEFEQIKEYIRGDDIRTINWRATARKGQLMVNNYTDERSQQVYCIIDKGRVMKMPFERMTLLDYAINATLALLRVALIKQDKAGLITFAEQIGGVLPANRKAGQMNNILEMLYNQQTKFLETDFEKLYTLIRSRITQRSLIILFTNFESMSGLERQLPYIRRIAKNHLLMVVFFENTELSQLTEAKVDDMESLYIKTIAERFVYEKRLMVKELQKHGIISILTPPEKLTVNAVNKYLELKAGRAI